MLKRWSLQLRPQRWPIAIKLSVALVTAAIVPAGLTSYYNFRQGLATVEQTELRNLQLLAVSTSSRLDQLIIDTQRVAEQMASDRQVVEFLSADPNDRSAMLSDVNRALETFRLSNEKDFSLTYLIDKNGVMAAIPPRPGDIGETYNNREYFRQAIQGHTYVSSILVGRTTKTPGLYFSAPVRKIEELREGDSGDRVADLQQYLNNLGFTGAGNDGVFGPSTRDAVIAFQQQAKLEANGVVGAATWKRLSQGQELGEIIGVAVLKMEGTSIWELVDLVTVGEGGYGFLVDREGIVIAHPDRDILYHSLAPLPEEAEARVAADRYAQDAIPSLDNPELMQALRGAIKPGSVSYFSERLKEAKVAGYAPLAHQPWVMAVSEPREEFVAPIRNLASQNAVTLLVVTGIAGASALLLARTIVKPIRALAGAAQALENDRFTTTDLSDLRDFASDDDDVGRLVRVFSNMAQTVKAREDKLKQQVRELEIEIDESKRQQQVREIVDTDFFQDLQAKARQVRQRGGRRSRRRPNETENPPDASPPSAESNSSSSPDHPNPNT